MASSTRKTSSSKAATVSVRTLMSAVVLGKDPEGSCSSARSRTAFGNGVAFAEILRRTKRNKPCRSWLGESTRSMYQYTISMLLFFSADSSRLLTTVEHRIDFPHPEAPCSHNNDGDFVSQSVYDSDSSSHFPELLASPTRSHSCCCMSVTGRDNHSKVWILSAFSSFSTEMSILPRASETLSSSVWNSSFRY